MLAKPEYFSPPNEVCCWRGAVKTGQAPRWSCWPGQVLARVTRRSAIWKMMAGALWRRGWPGRRGEAPSGSNCGRKCQCGSIGKRLLARPLWRRGWRGAVAKSHREATAGGSANAAASGRDCWPGRCGRARPPVQKSKGGQCDQRTASISAQIAGERTASVLCADCRRRGLEFEGDFCQEVDLCLRIYALPAEVFRTIYKVVLAIPSVRVVLFVEKVVYNSGEGNARAAL